MVGQKLVAACFPAGRPGIRFASRIGRAAGVVVGALVAASAAAQELRVAPDRYAVEPGQVVDVQVFGALFVPGHAGFGLPLPTRDLALLRLECVAGDGARALVPVEGAEGTARIMLRETGPAWIACVTAPKLVVIEPARFEAGLREAGLDAILAAREALEEGRDGTPARQRSSGFAKTLLDVRPGGGNPVLQDPSGPFGQRPGLLAAEPATDADRLPRTARPLGLELELVPLDDLCARAAGDAAPVRLLFRLLRDGRPVPGALVRAHRLPAPAAAAGVVADAVQGAGSAIDGGAPADRARAPGREGTPAADGIAAVGREGNTAGSPVPVARALDRRQPEAETPADRTDVNGVVALELQGAGPWLLVATQMRDLRFGPTGGSVAADAPAGRPAADYESLTTTLAFALRPR